MMFYLYVIMSPVVKILIDAIGHLHLRRQGAWMKHFFRIELVRREALAVAVLKQLVHFGPGFAKTPEINIGTRGGLLFFP